MRSRNVPVGVSIDGHATALTDALVRMADLTATGTALRLGGAGTNTKIVVEDSSFAGSVQLGGKTTLTLDNVRQTGGTLALDAAASTTLTVTSSAFAAVTTAVTGGSAAAFDRCRFDGGAVSGTASSPVAVGNSYVGTTSFGPHATSTNPIPTPQLGRTAVVQQAIPVGQTIHLDHDLPPGFVGFWLFGLGSEQPTIQAGFRVYLDPSTLAIYPGVYRAQGRVPFPVPPLQPLRGHNLAFQMLVGHDIGVAGPLRQIPPGGRVMLR
jgi:hypothetical protein